jgi:hypothetical protein
LLEQIKIKQQRKIVMVMVERGNKFVYICLIYDCFACDM